MASLKGIRTNQNLRHAFSDAGRFYQLSPSSTREAIVARQRKFAAQEQAAADHDGGHLDFLVAGDDTSPPSGNPLGSTVARLASAIAAMTYDHTAMHAGVARTAHDEGIADWFETVAKAGRSHAGEMRRALDNMR
ncbi:MAG: rubrerythrin [Acetobacteraceae bacterium]|jgi:rubrerythrin